MRQRISEKNVFPAFDLYEEYQKLEAIFSNWPTIGFYDRWGKRMTPVWTFEDYINNIQFESWNLRGTFITLQEMRTKLGIAKNNFKKGKVTENQLLDFVQFILNCWFRVRTTIEHCTVAYLSDKDALQMLLDDCRYLEDRLYCQDYMDKNTHEIYVVYQNDASAAVTQQNTDVEVSLTDYCRIDNRGDLQRKGEILCTLSKKLESIEAKIKGTEFYSLYNDTTFLLNKIGARHWTGKDELACATFMKMSDEELEGWYDTAYEMVVTCIAVIPYLDSKSKIKEIRKTEIKHD